MTARQWLQRYLIAIVPVLLALAWVFANAISVGTGVPPARLPIDVRELDDQSASLTIADVAGGTRAFHPAAPAVAEKVSAYRWFQIRLLAKPGEDVVLSVLDAPDDAELYYRRPDGTFGAISFGERRPFDARSFRTPFVATLVTSAMLAQPPIYVRSSGAEPSYGGGPAVPIVARTLSEYRAREGMQTSGAAGFVGFFFAMALISLFLGWYLRDQMFALHAALMITVIVWDLTEKYLSWEFLWPFASVGFGAAINVTFAAYLIALVLFARSFLSLKTTLPQLDRTLWIVLAANVVVAFTVDPLVMQGPVALASEILKFSIFVLLLASGILRWRRGFTQARFFVFGFAGLFVIFATAAIFTDAPLSRWAIDTGVACESLFFQFAIADRMLSIIRERDSAQRNALQAQEELAEDRRTSIERLESYNKAFARFVPREFLSRLGHEDVLTVQLGDSAALCMTVLFADIRGFTKLAEELSPRETFAFVNEFLAQVVPVIRGHQGFVDKFVGDGVLALFPSAAEHATDAAIELHQAVRRLNESRARGLRPPIAIGVGLHYGDVMLGTIGDEDRYETTVIADAVNIASRLEGLTKTLGANIVASADVIAHFSDRSAFRLRPLCPITLRGAIRETQVFEVCDADEPELLLRKVAGMELFESGIAAYRQQDFGAAKALFEEVLGRNKDDAPAAYFLSQCRLGTPSRSND